MDFKDMALSISWYGIGAVQWNLYFQNPTKISAAETCTTLALKWMFSNYSI